MPGEQESESEQVRSRRRQLHPALVALLDLFFVLSVVATVVILLSGGIRERIGDVTMTARTPERSAAAAVLLLVARRVLARGRGVFGTAPGSSGRVVQRWIAPDRDHALIAPGVTADARRSRMLALCGYGAIAVLMLHPQLAQMRAVPDLGDPIFSMWRIGWVFHQLQGDPRPLFDANIFHPEPLTLTFSDSMLLPALLAAPLLAAGLPPVVTYNVLLVLSFLVTAIATYLLVIRLTGSARAAFVAGLFYGFHPYRFEHYSHLELQMTWWMPIALLYLHRFLDTRRTRNVVLAGLCMVAQLYSSMYYAVFFALFAGVVTGAAVVLARVPLRRLAVPTAIAAALAAALAVPLARPYAAAQGARGDRPLTEVEGYSATLADYVRPHPQSALYAGRLLPPTYGERALFPGFAVLVLAAGALVPPLGVVRAAYLAGTVVAFDMSTGLNGVLYEPLYTLLSPLRGMRVPARFSIVLGLGLAVLAGFTVQRLLARARSERARTLVFGLLVAVFVVELRPAIELQPVWASPPSIYSAVADRDDVVLAEFPFRVHDPRSGWIDAMPQMYFSIWHGRAMVNGYSGFFPASYDPLLHSIGYFPDALTLDVFRARGVTHITVTCALAHDKPSCDGLIEKVESSAVFRQVAAAHWEGYPVRLYEMVSTPRP